MVQSKVPVSSLRHGHILGNNQYERAVQIGVGRRAGDLIRGESVDHLAGTDGNGHAVSHMLPTVIRVTGDQDGFADEAVDSVQEPHANLAFIRRRFGCRPNSATKDDCQIASVNLRCRISQRRQIQCLLGKANRIRSAVEVGTRRYRPPAKLVRVDAPVFVFQPSSPSMPVSKSGFVNRLE